MCLNVGFQTEGEHIEGFALSIADKNLYFSVKFWMRWLPFLFKLLILNINHIQGVRIGKSKETGWHTIEEYF